MAKTKTRRKVSSGKARRKARPSKNGAPKSAGQSDKFAPNQPPITGMEDVDERIPGLDKECQRYFSARDSVLSAREDSEEALHKIGELLHEHSLDLYILNGKKFFLEPGKETVKVKKVKQQ